MKKVIYIIALLIGVTTMAQTITVNGTPMLVSDDISFPFWLESGSSISPEVPVSSISVLEFNIVPNNNGNDMVFNQVISVTEGQTVPEGKTWKVESILMENFSFELMGNQNANQNSNNSNLFVPSNSYLNIIMEAPNYDSIYMSLSFQAKILPSGGSNVTERGFCYSSTNQEPNIFDHITTSGSGIGAFEANYNPTENFEYNTTYYVRSFATSFEGITYSDVFSFTTGSLVIPSIGNPYCGGIVFYLDETGEHGLIADVEDLEVSQWGCTNDEVQTTGSGIGSGYQNTVDISTDCSERPIAAVTALNHETKGYDDWYLPSLLELSLMYESIGSNGSFENSLYWSSFEYGITGGTNRAWAQNFTDGNQEGRQVNEYKRVRVIRSF